MALPAFSRSRKLAALALLPLATLLAGAHSAIAGTALIVCTATTPDSLYPGTASTPAALDATQQIYDRLIGHEPGIVKLVPGLAIDWNVSNDGTTYRLSLRRDVKWQANAIFTPSRDFAADDVIFSLERQWKPDHPYYGVIGTNHRAFDESGLSKLLKSIEKVDEYTVQITLNRPDSAFPAMLAMDFAAIQSKEYADQLLKAGTPEKFDEQPIGTGRFLLAAYSKEKIVHLKAFQQFWGGPAATRVTDVVFAITPDAAERYTRLKSGDCDLLTAPNPADLDAMRKDANLLVQEMPTLNISYLAFNTQKKPFDDIRVRRAFSLALDKKALVATAYPSNTGIAAVSPLPPVVWSYNKSLREDPYMPSAGKKILAEAGLPDGLATELWVPTGERPARIATMIQANLAQIGVKAEIKTMDTVEFTKRTRNGEHPLALMTETESNGDPDSILNTLLGCDGVVDGGRNVARWCNNTYQRLMMQGKSGIGIVDRQGYYEEAQSLFRKQLPWLPLAYETQQVVMRKAVTDFKISPFGRLNFAGVGVNK